MSDPIKQPINPCKRDCPNRNSECHSICDKYITYKNELDTYNTARNDYLHKSNEASYSIIHHTKYYKPTKRKR